MNPILPPLLDAAFFIVAGTVLFLMIEGKIKARRQDFLDRHKGWLKPIAVICILYGAYALVRLLIAV